MCKSSADRYVALVDDFNLVRSPQQIPSRHLQKAHRNPPPSRGVLRAIPLLRVPIDVLPPIPPKIFLHFLSCATGQTWFREIPGAHGESFFFQRLPKKKRTSIFDELQSLGDPRFRSAILYGWGIHIIKGPNHTALSLALDVGIVVSFVVLVCVMGIAQTQEQGFGVGQWLVAVVSCLLAALYSKLIDD